MLALMKAMLAREASDLHLSSETLPHMRIDGDMVAIEDYGLISPESSRRCSSASPRRRTGSSGRSCHDTDFAYEIAGGAASA